MKIDLEEPFRKRWVNGYVVVNPENRRNICLYNSQEDRTTISYARYLMCVHLGYILPDTLEVDHIDDDHTNDVLSNLQVLTKEQNLEKQYLRHVENFQYYRFFTCSYCTNPFFITEREYKKRIHCNPINFLPFCSAPCSWYFRADERKLKSAKEVPDSLARQLQVIVNKLDT